MSVDVIKENIPSVGAGIAARRAAVVLKTCTAWSIKYVFTSDASRISPFTNTFLGMATYLSQ